MCKTRQCPLPPRRMALGCWAWARAPAATRLYQGCSESLHKGDTIEWSTQAFAGIQLPPGFAHRNRTQKSHLQTKPIGLFSYINRFQEPQGLGSSAFCAAFPPTCCTYQIWKTAPCCICTKVINEPCQFYGRLEGGWRKGGGRTPTHSMVYGSVPLLDTAVPSSPLSMALQALSLPSPRQSLHFSGPSLFVPRTARCKSCPAVC